MPEFQSPQKQVPAPAIPATQGKAMTPPPFQLKSDPVQVPNSPEQADGLSARFKGEEGMQSMFDGTTTLKEGDTGMNVVKLQTALLVMGYKLPVHHVDGSFGPETKKALLKFQKDAGVIDSGELDKSTIQRIDERLDTRKDYIKAGKSFDKTKPYKGVHALKSYQQEAAMEALKQKPAAAGKTFDPKDGAAYTQEIADCLKVEIPAFHKSHYADKKDLRMDPAKNFHKKSTLEGAANAGRSVVKKVYGNLAYEPAYRFSKGTLDDNWLRQEGLNSKLTDPEKLLKAKDIVEYFAINACAAINDKYNAMPLNPEESKLLEPIIDSFTDTPEKVQMMLEIKIGWPGAQNQGKQFLQRFKDSDDETNRLRLWALFYTSIHEYIHTLAHKDYGKWAESLDEARRDTLIEGFADFFTINVRKQYPPSSLKSMQSMVEGPYLDKSKDIPAFESLPDLGEYSSAVDAERVVGIVGIHNAQMAYFKGKIKLMGAI